MNTSSTGTCYFISNCFLSSSVITEGGTYSVCFYGDLILSKSDRENVIVLWSITSFTSNTPIPNPDTAPTNHDPQTATRSAFFPPALTDGAPAQYSRLLQFSIPEGDRVWMRFSLFPGNGDDKGPVLAFCNSYSKVSFWDLRRLEAYHQITNGDEDMIKDPSLRPPFLKPFQSRKRGRLLIRGRGGRRSTPPTDSTNSQRSGSDMASISGNPKNVDWDKSLKGWEDRYAMGDPLQDLLAHKEEVVKGLGFCGRQIAWSGDGAWCVVVGSMGAWAVLQRWRKK